MNVHKVEHKHGSSMLQKCLEDAVSNAPVPLGFKRPYLCYGVNTDLKSMNDLKNFKKQCEMKLQIHKKNVIIYLSTYCPYFSLLQFSTLKNLLVFSLRNC